jgi:hypothetical protein
MAMAEFPVMPNDRNDIHRVKSPPQQRKKLKADRHEKPAFFE